MKALLFVLLICSSTCYSQNKNVFLSETTSIVGPDGKVTEQNVYRLETKVSIDYSLKIIKVNFWDKEFNYSFHNIEKIDSGDMFFEFDENQDFDVMMYSTVKNYLMFCPKDQTKDRMFLTKVKLLL